LILLVLLVLLTGISSTIIALFVLRTTRLILRLSERRMEYLVDEQRRLELLREQVRLLTETLGQEREERLAAQRKAELLESGTGPARAAKGKKNGRTNSAEG
jgi:uncharacterized coiled-coil protein SlyX